MTTEGHLKRPSVHQGRGQALLVLTMIRVLAYTLTLVFFSDKCAATSDILRSVFAIWRKGWPTGSLFRNQIPAELSAQSKPSAPRVSAGISLLRMLPEALLPLPDAPVSRANPIAPLGKVPTYIQINPLTLHCT
jgi:hypothetical protein